MSAAYPRLAALYWLLSVPHVFHHTWKELIKKRIPNNPNIKVYSYHKITRFSFLSISAV